MHRPDIKAKLLMAGFNQSKVAQEVGCTQSAVSRVISGELLSPPIAQRIADIVGSTVHRLWPGKYETRLVARRSRRAA